MGKVRTPKYRIETWVNVGRHTPAGWDGPATLDALKRYVCDANQSFMPGGVNERVSESAGAIVQIWMARIVRQSDGKVMTEWKAPPFSTLPVCP